MLLADLLLDRFRCDLSVINFEMLGEESGEPGYFRFGPDAICYGRVSAGFAADEVRAELSDLAPEVAVEDGVCRIPFNPAEVLDNLRRERYRMDAPGGNGDPARNSLVRKAYYTVRPLLPVAIRRHLQRLSLRGWERNPFPNWPVDLSVEHLLDRLLLLAIDAKGLKKIPFIWFWPEGKSGCSIMTHDVETNAGLGFCSSLMNINDAHAIKSSFQIIPGGRYEVPEVLLDEIRGRGFEVNVHDWNHDGLLFSDRAVFRKRVHKINEAARRFRAEGFRSGAMYRNLEWYDAFKFSYDMSVPNVAHLDPQQGGCCTVMPFFIGHILELPLTTTQDYPLFHILGDYSIELWKRQIDIISRVHGLISWIVHPDYVMKQRAQRTYVELLAYLSRFAVDKNIWLALPGEVNRWWRERSQMKIVEKDGRLEIEGQGHERARIAYARSDGKHLTYEFE